MPSNFLNKDLVRTWTELNRAFLLNKRGSEARIWYGLKFLDKKGQGWVPIHRAKDHFPSIVGVGRRRINDLIYNHGTTFWKTENQIVEINGQEQIANSLGVKLGFAVDIPISCFQNLSLFNATLFSTWFARETWRYTNSNLSPTGGKTISWKSLSRLFGHDKGTFRNWVRLASILVKKQFTYVKDVDEYTYVPEHVSEKGLSFLHDFDNDGILEKGWQVPNRYSSPSELVAELKRWQNGRVEGPSMQTWAKSQRLFYDNAPLDFKGKTKVRQKYVFKRTSSTGKRYFIQILD
jgi:hypothetical protein